MLFASFMLHGILYAAVWRDSPPIKEQPEVVEFEFINTGPSSAPELPAKVSPPILEPKVATRPQNQKIARVIFKPLPPPPPNVKLAATPSEASKALPSVIRIGISLGSTTAAGNLAVGVGNTLYGKADRVASEPGLVKPYSSAETRQAPYVSPSQVSTLPRLLQQIKASYPLEAKRAGVEGQVILKLRINDSGKVTRVTILHGPGYGLEEAAKRAAYGFRFVPATWEDKPVTTEITYTYTFVLEY
jgi:protein TonB